MLKNNSLGHRSLATVKAARSYFSQQMLLPVQEFIHTEAGSAVFLLTAAVLALLWANSPWSVSYFHLWETIITVDMGWLTISRALDHWVNDGLMAIFFFVIGLEIKREVVHGQLSDPRQAALPLFAALGGMILPVLIFLYFNLQGEGMRGWGIPMATDIAFALGVLALLGDRIPSQVRIFLLTLAVVDDIGSILVIAIFYTQRLFLQPLFLAALLIVVILLLQRLGVRNVHLYIVVGIFFWVAVLKSGIHATIAGVVLGALTPADPYFSRNTFVESARLLTHRFQQALDQGDEDKAQAVLGEFEDLSRRTEAPLERIERLVHPWSSFVILPIFALVNAGMVLSVESMANVLSSSVSQGIFFALMVGKFFGITAFSWIAVRLKIAFLPAEVSWPQILGTSLLAGIGFTVSLFITGLSYQNPQFIADAKIGILGASLLAGGLGYVFLRLVSRPTAQVEENN